MTSQTPRLLLEQSVKLKEKSRENQRVVVTTTNYLYN